MVAGQHKGALQGRVGVHIDGLAIGAPVADRQEAHLAVDQAGVVQARKAPRRNRLAEDIGAYGAEFSARQGVVGRHHQVTTGMVFVAQGHDVHDAGGGAAEVEHRDRVVFLQRDHGLLAVWRHRNVFRLQIVGGRGTRSNAHAALAQQALFAVVGRKVNLLHGGVGNRAGRLAAQGHHRDAAVGHKGRAGVVERICAGALIDGLGLVGHQQAHAVWGEGDHVWAHASV